MYQLVAFDMDGTLLNSKKEIMPESVEAIKKADAAGKIIVLNTGRCIAEVRKELSILPEVRYVNSVNGALVIDTKKEETIGSNLMSIETMQKLLAIARQEDIFVQIQHYDNIIQKDKWAKMQKYGMAPYQEMFGEVAIQWDNIIETYLANPFETAKMNFYHADTEARERTRKRVMDAGIPVVMTNAEITGIEFCNAGVDKGLGLEKLCDALAIPIEKTIVVGDANNDIPALKVAGLAVAMGNANEDVKSISDVMVKDCDHGGCVEVIEKYLLK